MPLPASSITSTPHLRRELQATETDHGHQAQWVTALGQGAGDYFTGTVRIDAPFKGSGDARVGGATVTFEPGAHTAWHTHPLGQTLLVTAGLGRVQREGGPIEEIRPGDIVWFEPGEKHWHGAAPNCAMTHIAIAEALDGRSVDWMEKVTDAQYGADRETP
jgi:quercetin dioxygenase-like cupin family protein